MTNIRPHSYRTAATLMRDILDGIEALLAERPMLAAVRVGSTTLGNQRAELKARLNELQPDGPNCRQVVERHRRHVELSPGVGADVQRYALAVCDDILSDLPHATGMPQEKA